MKKANIHGDEQSTGELPIDELRGRTKKLVRKCDLAPEDKALWEKHIDDIPADCRVVLEKERLLFTPPINRPYLDFWTGVLRKVMGALDELLDRGNKPLFWERLGEVAEMVLETELSRLADKNPKVKEALGGSSRAAVATLARVAGSYNEK